MKLILYRDALGYTLRTRRLAKGKTLRQVAKAAPIALGYLSEVERGQKELSSELLVGLAQGLDTTVGELTMSAAQVMTDWEQQVEEIKIAVTA